MPAGATTHDDKFSKTTTATIYFIKKSKYQLKLYKKPKLPHTINFQKANLLA